MSLLTVKNLNLALPHTDQKLLSEINFVLAAGDSIAIVGSNGSGKSTLVDCLAGNNDAYTGNILIDGIEIKTTPSKDRARRVRLLNQDPSQSVFPNLTMRENITIAKRCFGEPKGGLDDATFLNKIRPNLAEHLNSKVAQLSGGERQALAIAMMLINPPKLLLLDEHTSALDQRNTEYTARITEEITQQLNIATIIITHDIANISANPQRILIMRGGAISSVLSSNEINDMTQNELAEVFYL